MPAKGDPTAAAPVGVPAAERPTIGWAEYVGFPDWGIDAIKAKVDTGARISALHVDRIRPLRDGNVEFEVVLHRKHHHRRVRAEAAVLRRSRIRSSNGVYQQRYVVPARIRLGGMDLTVEVSLVSRPEMIFMLLGRDALGERFLIDASRECLLGRPRRRRRRRRRQAAKRTDT